jgi:hypothetical protein
VVLGILRPIQKLKRTNICNCTVYTVSRNWCCSKITRPLLNHLLETGSGHTMSLDCIVVVQYSNLCCTANFLQSHKQTNKLYQKQTNNSTVQYARSLFGIIEIKYTVAADQYSYQYIVPTVVFCLSVCLSVCLLLLLRLPFTDPDPGLAEWNVVILRSNKTA